MTKIKLGPAGSSGLGGLEGVKEVARLGLDAMEIEFTYGVNMSVEKAKEIGKVAKKLGIQLSVHAPYYCNLASLEKQKIGATRARILQSCDRGHYLGAKHIVFHAGFYQKRPAEKVYEIIKEQILKIQDEIKKKGYDVLLSPETTGKPSQFGSLEELMSLVKETKCSICVDFAHILARNNGRIDYNDVFKKLKPLRHVHCHFAGIEYTEKGERRHLITKEKDIKELLGYCLKSNKKMTIINESPDPLGDTLKTKRILENMK